MDKYRVTAIDGLHGGPSIRVNEEKNPGDHGGYPLANLLDARTFSIEGEVFTGNIAKMRDLEQAMRTAFYSMVERPLIMRTGNAALDVYIMCRINDQIGLREEQSKMDRFRRSFRIPLRATDPRIYSVQRRTYREEAIEDGDNLILPTNAGNWPAAPKLHFEGPMIDPVVLNATFMPDESFQRQLKINGTIASGDIYTYDAQLGTLTDQTGERKDAQLDVSSREIRLTTGENQLQLSTTGTEDGISAFEVSFQDTWV